MRFPNCVWKPNKRAFVTAASELALPMCSAHYGTHFFSQALNFLDQNPLLLFRLLYPCASDLSIWNAGLLHLALLKLLIDAEILDLESVIQRISIPS